MAPTRKSFKGGAEKLREKKKCRQEGASKYLKTDLFGKPPTLKLAEPHVLKNNIYDVISL